MAPPGSWYSPDTLGGHRLDEEPLRDQLQQHTEALYRFALSITRDPHLAADLVQDTMVRALERADQYRGDAALISWLKRILHNLAIDKGRRASKELLVDEVEESWMSDVYSVDPVAVAEQLELRSQLEEALLRLPFIYRTTLILHDAEQWTVAEIAELQGISVPACKQRLRRGRMAMVTALDEADERALQSEGVPMRCWDARKHISDYLDGQLPIEEAALLEGHLGACPTCPPLYASLVASQEKMGSLRDPNSVVPPELDKRIRAAVAG